MFSLFITCTFLPPVEDPTEAAGGVDNADAGSGGFDHARQLLQSENLPVRARAFYIGTQTAWTWYTEEIRCIKNPHDGFAETIRLATSAHNLFEEVRLHVCHCLYEEKSLEWIGFTRGAPLSSLNDQQMQVEEYVDMVLELAKNRAWAKMDYRTPPLAYAGIASATIAV